MHATQNEKIQTTIEDDTSATDETGQENHDMFINDTATVRRAEIRYRRRSIILGTTMIVSGITGITIDVVQSTMLHKRDWSRFNVWLWIFPAIFCVLAGTFSIPTGIFKRRWMYICCTSICGLTGLVSGISVYSVALEFNDVYTYHSSTWKTSEEYESKWRHHFRVELLMLSCRLAVAIVALVVSVAQAAWSCNMCCCVHSGSNVVYVPIIRIHKPSNTEPSETP